MKACKKFSFLWQLGQEQVTGAILTSGADPCLVLRWCTMLHCAITDTGQYDSAYLICTLPAAYRLCGFCVSRV